MHNISLILFRPKTLRRQVTEGARTTEFFAPSFSMMQERWTSTVRKLIPVCRAMVAQSDPSSGGSFTTLLPPSRLLTGIDPASQSGKSVESAERIIGPATMVLFRLREGDRAAGRFAGADLVFLATVRLAIRRLRVGSFRGNARGDGRFPRRRQGQGFALDPPKA